MKYNDTLVFFLLLTTLLFLAVTSTGAKRPPIARELEERLEGSYSAFALQARSISPQSPNYWRHIWRLWNAHELDQRWRDFSNKLRENAMREATAERGIPE